MPTPYGPKQWRSDRRLREWRTPLDVAHLPADALFPIYSITKTLTAISVLRLAEIGTLRLGDSVRQWLPALNVPAEITLTQLLRHTSGLRDYGPLPEYHKAVRTDPDKPWTRAQFDAAAEGTALCAGRKLGLLNVGYMLLIDVVEYVTGQTFASAERSGHHPGSSTHLRVERLTISCDAFRDSAQR
jgi:D-alanyl-D-alanine carboxypeptidase